MGPGDALIANRRLIPPVPMGWSAPIAQEACRGDYTRGQGAPFAAAEKLGSLTEKSDYDNNVTWVVDNRPREKPTEHWGRVWCKRRSQATNTVARFA